MLIYVQMSVLEVQAFYINMDHYSTFRRHIQPKSTEGIAFFRRNMGAGGTYYETVQSRNHRRHRHGGPAFHHADGASPLVSADGHRRQRTQRRQTLRRGGGGPLGPGRPHAGGGQKSGGPGRGAGRGAAGLHGGFLLLRRGHEERGDPGPGGEIRETGVPHRLQQLRPPVDRRCTHGSPGDQRGPSGGDRGPAQAPGHPPGLHRREEQLFAPELRPGPAPPEEVRPGQNPGLHLSGHLRRRQDLPALAGDGG